MGSDRGSDGSAFALGVPEQRGEFIAGGGYLGIRTPAAESAGRAEQLVEPTRVRVSFR